MVFFASLCLACQYGSHCRAKRPSRDIISTIASPELFDSAVNLILTFIVLGTVDMERNRQVAAMKRREVNCAWKANMIFFLVNSLIGDGKGMAADYDS